MENPLPRPRHLLRQMMAALALSTPSCFKLLAAKVGAPDYLYLFEFMRIGHDLHSLSSADRPPLKICDFSIFSVVSATYAVLDMQVLWNSAPTSSG